ncbi:MAG: 4Fe-4S dicluster domain-containing protein [Promethearchaeota archaeon]|nr:MAG: 4Fe-4S dicluster domain-containing protein [Candidatus Lokiarchaeota archaeon]
MTNDKEMDRSTLGHTNDSTQHSISDSTQHSIRRSIQLIEGLCVNCGWCTSYCFYGALGLDSLDNLVIRSEKCQNCGLCFDVCPRNALYLGK